MRLEEDDRLIAAVAGGVAYLACAAGLGEREIASLRSVTAGVCEEAFGQMDEPHGPIDVTILRYPDRIEIALLHPGSAAPAVGLETLAGFAKHLDAGVQSPFQGAGVDRVQFESQGGSALTRLTKYLGPPAPAA